MIEQGGDSLLIESYRNGLSARGVITTRRKSTFTFTFTFTSLEIVKIRFERCPKLLETVTITIVKKGVKAV